MIKTALLVLFSLLSINVNAQNPIIYDDPESYLPLAEQEELWLQRRQYKINKIGVSVHTPPSFSEISSFRILSPRNSSSSSYTFVNKDSTVLIVIALMQRDSVDYAKDAALATIHVGLFEHSVKGSPRYYEKYDPDLQWYINFKADIDSVVFKPVFYQSDQLKRFNAEDGVQFKKTYQDLHLGKYETARNITLNRKYRGIIEIQYFTVPNANVNIEKEVQMAAQMISFTN